MDLTHSISLLKDAVSIMIPVITGFIVLFCGLLMKLWQTTDANKRKAYPWMMVFTTVFTSFISLFFCFGVMLFCINASLGMPDKIHWVFEANPEKMVYWGKLYLHLAYGAFSGAIGAAFFCYYQIIRDKA